MLYYASFPWLSIQNRTLMFTKKKPIRNSLSTLPSSNVNSVYDRPIRK